MSLTRRDCEHVVSCDSRLDDGESALIVSQGRARFSPLSSLVAVLDKLGERVIPPPPEPPELLTARTSIPALAVSPAPYAVFCAL